MKYTTIAERGKFLVDAPGLTDETRAQRYLRYYGKRVRVDTVRRARELFYQRQADAPIIRSFYIKL